MNDPDLMLSPEERELIRRSFDLRTSRRRQWVSLATSVALALGVVAVAVPLAWPLPLVPAFVGYVALAAYERWLYGRAVLAYKSVIAKLWSHVERRESAGKYAVSWSSSTNGFSAPTLPAPGSGRASRALP